MNVNNFLSLQEQEKFLLALIAGSDIQLSLNQRALKKAFEDGATLTGAVLAALIYKANNQVFVLDFMPYFVRFTDKAVLLLKDYLSEAQLLKRAVGILLGISSFAKGAYFTKSTNYSLAYALDPEEAKKFLSDQKDWQRLADLGEKEFVRQMASEEELEKLEL